MCLCLFPFSQEVALKDEKKSTEGEEDSEALKTSQKMWLL